MTEPTEDRVEVLLQEGVITEAELVAYVTRQAMRTIAPAAPAPR